ncbi:HAMP domain-containing histidine kinase [Marivibrio halodurans]|uniref:histidine kinase n=1 Tax=Marivibrio halodurans TaxID=2039722 RepID=A0A8J7SN28_9PROT|nr:HAMP domain-containing sensor histidine kinase [Marivibrio halodurans]MBP5857763.1 HAMP domain-containing histidine kinase [Marivibrio halodurans]
MLDDSRYAHSAPSIEKPDVSDARLREELRARFHQSPFPALSNMAVGTILVGALWRPDIAWALVIWLAAMAGSCGLRLWCRRVATGSGSRMEASRLDRMARASVLLSGVLWGLCGLVVAFGSLPPLSEALVAIAVGGMMAGAIFSLTPDLVAFRLYVLPASVGPILGFASIQTVEHLSAAAMGCIYAFVVWSTGHRFGHGSTRRVRLILENEALVAKLAAAQESAAIAERLKSNSFAIIGHEFRSPLNAIAGFADTIRSEIWGPVGDPRYKDYSERIMLSAQHLNDLANSVLDLGRSEYGALTLSVAPVSLDRIVVECRDMLNGLSREKGVAIHTPGLAGGAERDRPCIRGDATKLRQVLINIVANAIRFTPSGGCVTIALVEEEGGAVVLTVRDTGIGMAEETVNRVFEPFAASEADDAQGGTSIGLGLALSKRLVELHDGSIAIESKLGEGTAVRITFPPERRLEPSSCAEERAVSAKAS